MLQEVEADLDLDAGCDLFQTGVGELDDDFGENEEGRLDEAAPVGDLGREPSDEQVLREMEDVPTAEESARRRSRLPQPKLNEATICSEKGIPTIPKMFENFLYDSRKDEFANMDRVMNKLEHWAHCLFPKIAFDDFIARAEVLGRKKPVQTCLTKIRLDMPLLDDDFENASVDRESNELTALVDPDERDHPDQFNHDINTSFSPPRSPTPVDSPPTIPKKTTLTEEQRARMEANRLKAMEIRRKKMEDAAKMDLDSSPQLSSVHSGMQATGVSDSVETTNSSAENNNDVELMNEDELLMALDGASQ